MTLKQVLKKALEIIGEEIDLDGEALDEKGKKLVSCGNMIYSELVEEYAPLRHTEEVTVYGGKLYFSDLSKNLKEIIRVKKNGENIPYVKNRNFLDVGLKNNGPCTVVYTYHPFEVDLNDELILPTTFSAERICSGIASEYFYRSGLIDEALFYKNRYDITVSNLMKKRPTWTLHYRRFI